ncbi:MAG: glycosyltransferase family 4 protein [Planctomycetes bacterium]|nr:glycosyltransferase family 4 protein [Planctomycetota bacterium]
MTAKLRTAYILEATAGGTRKHMLHLVSAARSAGHEVCIIVNAGRDPDFGDDIDYFRKSGCVVHVVDMVREISPWTDLRALGEITRLLKRFRPHIVHTHAAKAGALGRMAASRLAYARVVHTPHTLPYEWADGTRSIVYRCMETFLGRLTHAMVALTRAQQASIRAAHVVMNRTPVEVIHNGVLAPETIPPADARKFMNVGPADTVIAQVARLAPQKACRVFAEAAALLGKPGFRFVLFGDGPMRAELTDKVAQLGLPAGRFTFMGYVPHAERYYSGVDIMVLTSLYEGLPYVALEAMACGLPVIAPHIPGMSEVIDDGISGILVPVENASATAEAVRLLADDAELRQDMGRNGRRRVVREFNHAVFVENHLELYNRLAAQTP